MYKNYIIIVKPVRQASLNFKPSKTASKPYGFMCVERRNFILKKENYHYHRKEVK